MLLDAHWARNEHGNAGRIEELLKTILLLRRQPKNRPFYSLGLREPILVHRVFSPAPAAPPSPDWHGIPAGEPQGGKLNNDVGLRAEAENHVVFKNEIRVQSHYALDDDEDDDEDE